MWSGWTLTVHPSGKVAHQYHFVVRTIEPFVAAMSTSSESKSSEWAINPYLNVGFFYTSRFYIFRKIKINNINSVLQMLE